mgnify:CR=1 FL=1
MDGDRPSREATSVVDEGLVGRARRAERALLLVAIALVAASLHALTVGAMPIALDEIFDHVARLLSGAAPPEGDMVGAVVVDLRAPRVLLTLLVGGALGVTGAALQGLFRNPLADARLLGITSGAALFASCAIVSAARLRLSASLQDVVADALRPAAAFVGALLATLVVARLGSRGGRTITSTLILAGVALSSLAEAGVGLVLFLANDAELRDITFWTLGSMAGATWSTLVVVAPPIVLGLVVFARQARALDALALGESVAFHLGVSVEDTKRAVIFASAIVVGPAVAACGAIGFVGLVVPHVWRLVVGPAHGPLVVGSGALGALVLLLADGLARTVVAPAELPIGVVTAGAGAPFFLYLVATHARGHEA